MSLENRREQIQKEMVIRQVQEINKVIQQLQDMVEFADKCNAMLVVISRPTAKRAIRNLEDFEKRYLVGQI